MPRGLPDYGQATEQYAIAGMADLGELAARLNSINVYDRRGFTIWMDDFEAPLLRWTPGFGGAGVAPVLSTTTSFLGVQSAFMNCPAAAVSRSDMHRILPLIRRGKVGIELWLQGFTKTTGYLQIQLYMYDGVSPNYAELRYDTDAQTISIVHALGTTIIATNVYMTNTGHYFLPIKLVADMDTDMYVRLLVGETEYDISAYGLVLLPASANKFIQVAINLFGSAADDMWMYVDNGILTQNEP